MGRLNEKVEPMLTSTEVARLLNIHINTVRRWSDKGILASYRLGPRGDRRYKQSDIDVFLRQGSPDGNDTDA